MCGLVGIAGDLAFEDERIFKTLLLLDYFRGQDSTGVTSVSKRKNLITLKVADDPIILMQHNDFEAVINGVTDAVWMGHNRASTIGASTRANAHPFECGHIVGMHNGTLEKQSMQELADRLDETYGTDSETIFQHMAKYGVDDTISLLQGAWALIWYDMKEHTLNMLRNDERPLYTCEMQGRNRAILTWASDYKMISAARAMSDTSLDLVSDDEGYAYFPVPINTLHTWDFDDLVTGDFKPKTRALTGKPKKAVIAMSSPPPANTSPANHVVDTFSQEEVIVTEEQEGFLFGGAIEEAEWEEMSQFGCSFCGVDVHPEDEGLMIFPAESIVLCPGCSSKSVTTIETAFATSEFAQKLM